jgi:hypothetical protein
VTLIGRIRKLEQDVAQAKRDRALESRWVGELKSERRQLAALESASHTSPRKGCDYSWSRPSVADLHEQGFTFAGRYLTGGGKAHDREEAVRLSQGRIALVSIFEDGAQNMLGGSIGGRTDGEDAYKAARALSMPRGRPIFFAADWEVDPQQVDACIYYLQAARRELKGDYFAGVYGGRRLIEAAHAAGFHYLYQTLAWSGGVRLPYAQLYQSAIAGSIDTDYAYAADFGQWTV